jgi:U4/U6 small nuclear ribonucleoprotein PRP4
MPMSSVRVPHRSAGRQTDPPSCTDTQPAPGFDASISRARDADAALVAALESRKTARSLAVPTDDAKVRQRLRQLGQPITLFGERRPDRRERLREELVKEGQRREQEGEEAESVVSEESEEEEVSVTRTRAACAGRP